jgi:hypothetical protein
VWGVGGKVSTALAYEEPKFTHGLHMLTKLCA